MYTYNNEDNYTIIPMTDLYVTDSDDNVMFK